MNVEVNYLAVFLAAASSMVVGSIWYAKGVFGKTWGRLAKVDMSSEVKPKEMGLLLGSTFMASLATAFVLAHFTFLANEFFRQGYLSSALQAAFWLWLGFTAARIYVHDAFEGRRKQLTLLNVVHELVTFLVMALIIGLLKP